MCCEPFEEAHRDGDGLLAGEESALAAGIVELVGVVPPQIAAEDTLGCRVIDFGDLLQRPGVEPVAVVDLGVGDAVFGEQCTDVCGVPRWGKAVQQ